MLIFERRNCFVRQSYELNYSVNLSHEADSFGQGHNYLLIMVKVFKGEIVALAVFEPFMADLIPDTALWHHYEKN